MALPFGYLPPGNYLPTPTPSPQPTSTVSVGSSVQTAQDELLETAPGIVPLSFYSPTNAAGQMLRAGVAAAVPVDLPFRGSIVGVAVRASGANTGTYTVYVDGAATAAEVALAAETSNLQTYEKSSFEVAAGQTIDPRISGESGANPVEVIIYISIDPSTIL